MKKTGTKEGEVIPQKRSSFSSMNTVVALAQQRDAMLGRRLDEIGSIEQDLLELKETHTAVSTGLK